MIDLDQLVVEHDPEAPPSHIQFLATSNRSEVCACILALLRRYRRDANSIFRIHQPNAARRQGLVIVGGRISGDQIGPLWATIRSGRPRSMPWARSQPAAVSAGSGNDRLSSGCFRIRL